MKKLFTAGPVLVLLAAFVLYEAQALRMHHELRWKPVGTQALPCGASLNEKAGRISVLGVPNDRYVSIGKCKINGTAPYEEIMVDTWQSTNRQYCTIWESVHPTKHGSQGIIWHDSCEDDK